MQAALMVYDSTNLSGVNGYSLAYTFFYCVMFYIHFLEPSSQVNYFSGVSSKMFPAVEKCCQPVTYFHIRVLLDVSLGIFIASSYVKTLNIYPNERHVRHHIYTNVVEDFLRFFTINI